MRSLLLCVLILMGAKEIYCQSSNNKSEPAPAVIYGEINFDSPVDTLFFKFREKFFVPNGKIPLPLNFIVLTEPGNLFQGNIGERTFKIEIPAFSEPAYIDLYADQYNLFKMFVIEPGDSLLVHIDTKDARMSFWGNAAEKFRVQYELTLAGKKESLSRDPIMVSMNQNRTREKFMSDSVHLAMYNAARQKADLGYGRLLRYLNPGDEELDYMVASLNRKVTETEKWRTLQRNKQSIPPRFYEMLEANIVGEFLNARASGLNRHISSTDERVASAYNGLIQKDILYNFSDYAVLHSEPYLHYLMSRCILQAIREGKSMSEIVKTQLSGEVRDRVMARFLFTHYKQIKNGHEAIQKSLQFIESPWVRAELELLHDTQKPGALFEFELRDLNGHLVRMQDFRGKVALIDFWFTGCGACVISYNQVLKKVIEHFEGNKNFTFISISADEDQERWLKSVTAGNYTSSHNINLNTGGYNHELLRKYDIHSYPHLMLIDQEGKISKSGGLKVTAEELISIIKAVLDKD